ncbi:ferrochelatase [Snodgrassella gandavensis]|uniref:ferrochelatase n=1 Tax=Snodgrassella gandavensis TaxID=2946698 RepID=UPI001EF65575|nr:ferrochelatase [Snodgrassella gandavensis]
MSKLFLSEPDTSKTAIGVLLLNLGTPSAPTPQAVRSYLREFLSDQRVVELPRCLWQLILRGIVLPIRGRKSAHAYGTIWQDSGSPLLTGTQSLTTALAKIMPKGVITRFAMTYGQPSVANVLQEMKQQGVKRLLVLPLYPQYAGSSSGAALDQVWRVMLKQRVQMAVRSITSFYADSNYIKILARHIQAYWQQYGRGQCLLLSYHGIPQAQHQAGDEYVEHCTTTTRLLVAELGLQESEYRLAFQSRFGYAPWVGPSTQDLLIQLPQSGINSLDIVCPGFVTDCLETLEEIDIRGKADFLAHGGKQFQYIPCMNSEQEWVEVLAPLIRQHLQGWL